MQGIDTRELDCLEYEPRNGRRGAVVIFHGLNVRPETFEPLAKVLCDAGIAVIVPRLTGHRGKWREEWRAPSAERWLNEAEGALMRARDRYGRFSLIGYSQGALLSAALLERGWAPYVDKLLFLAPAFAIRGWVKFWRWLPWSLPACLPIPSFIPSPYCAARLTSPVWYRALFNLYAEVTAAGKEYGELKKIKTLILIDPYDELISYAGLVRWGEALKVDCCEVRTVTRARVDRKGFPAHLLYDPRVFSEKGWEEFIIEIKDFLIANSSENAE